MNFQIKLLLGASKDVVTKYLYVLSHPCILQAHSIFVLDLISFGLDLFTFSVTIKFNYSNRST